RTRTSGRSTPQAACPAFIRGEKNMQAAPSQVVEALREIDSAGLRKDERLIDTPQRAHIALADGQEVLNLCANNYLGLADHPEIIQAAHEALDRYGYGMASVRFICGT